MSQSILSRLYDNTVHKSHAFINEAISANHLFLVMFDSKRWEVVAISSVVDTSRGATEYGPIVPFLGFKLRTLRSGNGVLIDPILFFSGKAFVDYAYLGPLLENDEIVGIQMINLQTGEYLHMR